MIPFSMSIINKGEFIFSTDGDRKLSETELTSNSKFENITELYVGIVEENIAIFAHDKNVIEVNYFGIKNHKILMENKDGYLSIKHKKQWNLFNWTVGPRVYGRLEIYIPKNQIKKITLENVNGTINVDAVSSNLIVETVSGAIDIHQEGENADLSSISGNISVFKPFDSLEFETITGAVKVNTKIGSILEGSTVSGGVNAILCAGCVYNIDFESVSGLFTDEYQQEITEDKTNKQKGPSDVSIDVQTVNGNMKLGNWE